MRIIYLRFVWIILLVVLGLAVSSAVAGEAGFKSIFDGRTLNGWKASDMSYWSVQDGAITARSTRQHPVKENQFLVWQLGQVDDFELKLKYRISGTPSANSGIQIRSRVKRTATPSATRRTSTWLGDMPARFTTNAAGECLPRGGRNPLSAPMAR